MRIISKTRTTFGLAVTATVTTSALSVGVHNITAQYLDDVNFVGSTSSVYSDTVNRAATTTAVVADHNPSVYGTSVTFTATVSATAPGAGTPSGSVTFKDGPTTLGTGTLSGGQATYSTSALAAGVHSITAQYGSDADFNGSTSAAYSDTVLNSGTNVALVADVNQIGRASCRERV